MMRYPVTISLMVSVAACGNKQPDPWDRMEAQRATPLQSKFAINDEYKISAVFPKDHPVCLSDSGGHSHGFYQPLDGTSCADRAQSKRFLSVWADYNAMEFSWAGAPAEYCGTDTTPLDLGVRALGEGKLSACRTIAATDQEITVIYLTDDPEQDLFKPKDGPELIYKVRLGTSAATQADDVAILRTLLANTTLAGSGFRTS